MDAATRQGGVATLPWRNLLRTWHRWFGLGAALWLLLLSVTGSAIVFYDELDRWLIPDWRSVPAASGLVAANPVDQAILKAQRGLPGFTPRFVDLPSRADDTIMMIGTVARTGEAPQPVQVFSDPRDGRLLGWRASGRLAFDRRHIMNSLYALHMDLMLGPAMAWFLGLVALLWVIDHVVAAILAFPRASKWRSAFLVKGRGGSLKWLFDLHRAFGVWLFPLTLTIAISGLALTWQEEVRAVVRLISPVTERLHEGFPDVPTQGTGIGVDAALRRAAEQSGAKPDSVLLLQDKGVYGVRSFDPRDLDGIGRLWTYVAVGDGKVVAQRHDNGAGAGDAFFAWQYPLHSGKAFGLVGRLAILMAGIATIALCATGIWLWLRRTA